MKSEIRKHQKNNNTLVCKKQFLFFLCFIAFVLYPAQKKIEKLDAIFDKFSNTINRNTDSAFYYCKEAEKLNKKIGNEYYAARCHILFATYYYNSNNIVKAKEYNQEALMLAKKTSNISVLYRVYVLNGAMYYEASEYDKAFTEFQKASFYLKKKPDNKYLGILHLNLGNLFTAKGDTISGIKNYRLTAKYSILAKDTARLLASYMLIANVLKYKKHNDAHQYYEKAFHLAVLTHDIQEQFNIRVNQSSNFLEAKDYRALNYLQKAELILKKIKAKSLYFHIYFNYGAYYMNKNDYRNAIKYYELSYSLYNPNIIPIAQKLNILKNLSEIYKKNNNYQKSYNYQTILYKLKDSLFTIEKEKNYNQLLAKYEVEKKNSQIKLLSQENELQEAKKTRIYMALASVSTLLLIVFIFYRNKLKTQDKLNKKQQELNRTKHLMEGQNSERNRLAKDLHDGVAGSLAGINYMLDKENETLQNQKLTAIKKHIDILHSEIREISHNLSEHFLAEKTFHQLLIKLSDQNDENNIITNILFFPENALDLISDNMKTHLYRITQELFTNIRKHAKATSVQITVTKNENDVCMIIEDNGSGFSESKPQGIGLKNIKERLQTFDAKMEIDSYPGKGTTIIITFKI